VPKNASRITRAAPRKGSRAAAPSLPYEPWLIERLGDPAEAAAYLDAVIEEGDDAALMLARRQVVQAQASRRSPAKRR
jgi:hypothetical protein